MFDFQPVQIGVEGQRDGRLVFVDQRLVAVLTCLEAEDDGAAGHWFLETGLGPLAGPDQPIFPTLDAARDWILERLSSQAEA